MAPRILWSDPRQPGQLEILLQDGATGTDNGKWFEAKAVSQGNILVSGITTATVELHVSNNDSLPADAADGYVLDSLTADGVIFFLGPFKYLKLKVSSYSSGTIYGRMYAHSL